MTIFYNLFRQNQRNVFLRNKILPKNKIFYVVFIVLG
jgi:hypothetical protein